MTPSAPKPIIGSQRFRLIESICARVATALGIGPEDLFTVFQARLCQVVDTSIEGQPKTLESELWRPIVDAAIFPMGSAGAVASVPALLVFLDRDESEYQNVLDHLDQKGIAYLFSSEESLLNPKERQTSLETLIPGTLDAAEKGKLFGRAENRIFSAIAAAILRKDFKTEVLLTGQTVLSAFTDFSGYSHDEHKNQTDSDLLVCTAPPVSIPLLAIEVDGPLHFSEECWIQHKNHSPRAAKAKVERERAKTLQKDDALRKAGIPVLHIRVDQKSKRAREILDRHTNTLAKLIGRIVDHIDSEGEIIKKKYDYLHSVAERFAAVREAAYSTHPELEDLVHIAPELIGWLIQNLRDLDAESKDLQSRLDLGYMDQPPASPEEAYGYPILEQSERLVLRDLETERLFEKLTCRTELPPDRSSPVSTIQVRVLYTPPIGETLELCTFKETVPWMDIGGRDAKHFRRLLDLELADILGYLYFKRLPPAEKDLWKSRVMEHLSTEIDRAEYESRLREFRERYSKDGINFLNERIDQRLRAQMLRQLEARGYVAKDTVPGKSPAISRLMGRLVWIHKKIPCPDCWAQAGELSNVPLETLLDVFHVLDAMTRKAVFREFDSFLDTQLNLYRQIPIRKDDWAPLNQHIKGLKHALGTGAPSTSDN